MGSELRSNCHNARVRKIKDKDKVEKLFCLGAKHTIENDAVHEVTVKATVKLELKNK